MKKIKPKVLDGKTVFQEFADFLALDKGNRDMTYEVFASKETLVIHRLPLTN